MLLFTYYPLEISIIETSYTKVLMVIKIAISEQIQVNCKNINSIQANFYFHTPWKPEKTTSLLMLSGSVFKDHRIGTLAWNELKG